MTTLITIGIGFAIIGIAIYLFTKKSKKVTETPNVILPSTGSYTGSGNCVQVTFTANQGFGARAVWQDCAGKSHWKQLETGESHGPVCALKGSYHGLPTTIGDEC